MKSVSPTFRLTFAVAVSVSVARSTACAAWTTTPLEPQGGPGAGVRPVSGSGLATPGVPAAGASGAEQATSSRAARKAKRTLRDGKGRAHGEPAGSRWPRRLRASGWSAAGSAARASGRARAAAPAPAGCRSWARPAAGPPAGGPPPRPGSVPGQSREGAYAEADFPTDSKVSQVGGGESLRRAGSVERDGVAQLLEEAAGDLLRLAGQPP